MGRGYRVARDGNVRRRCADHRRGPVDHFDALRHIGLVTTGIGCGPGTEERIATLGGTVRIVDGAKNASITAFARQDFKVAYDKSRSDRKGTAGVDVAVEFSVNIDLDG